MLFLEAELKQPPPVQTMIPSQTKTISVDIGRPSIVTGNPCYQLNWQTSGGIPSRSTVVSGLESLHNHSTRMANRICSSIKWFFCDSIS